MADIIKSREAVQKNMAKGLNAVTRYVNAKMKQGILSPLTVTLGDEFQGVLSSTQTGLEMILCIEEWIIEKQPGFKLRYVLGFGPIETPINHTIAHGMLGAGLTRTRERLNELKKTENRFSVSGSSNDHLLNDLFVLYQSITDDWNPKDYPVIHDFIRYNDYKKVADRQGKTWSQMWKRKKTLKIKEYNILKNLITGNEHPVT
ncbi:MAG: hypothetical protein KF862_06640 [Chitinophagaceae bacterium]|nr:hypothetical protein [Chitinophagaceae bacterium]